MGPSKPALFTNTNMIAMTTAMVEGSPENPVSAKGLVTNLSRVNASPRVLAQFPQGTFNSDLGAWNHLDGGIESIDAVTS